MSDKICYRCGSSHVTKNGITATGYQRYRCRDCGRSFHCKSEYVGTSSRRSSSFSYRPSSSSVSPPERQPNALEKLLNSPVDGNKPVSSLNIALRWIFSVVGALFALFFLTGGKFFSFLLLVLSVVILCPAIDKQIDSRIPIFEQKQSTRSTLQFVISWVLFLIGFVIGLV